MQLHAQDQIGERQGTFQSVGGFSIVELEDYSWRADVTPDNLAAAQAMGWTTLRRLLLLAQQHRCEALELAKDNLVLPAVLEFELFPWP